MVQPHKPAGRSDGGQFDRVGGNDSVRGLMPPTIGRMSTKSLEATLYDMGLTFNNLSSTRLATTEFLRTGNPAVLGSRDDLALLEDLRDAARVVTRYDYAHDDFSLAFVRQINGAMTRSAAITPGVLRTRANIVVRLEDGSLYTPPVPDGSRLDAMVRRAGGSAGTIRDAARLFVVLAKAQPFGDGNKRTALLAANGLLVKVGCTQPITVPTGPADVRTFNRLLSHWYRSDDESVVDWLTDWNVRHVK